MRGHRRCVCVCVLCFKPLTPCCGWLLEAGAIMVGGVVWCGDDMVAAVVYLMVISVWLRACVCVCVCVCVVGVQVKLSSSFCVNPDALHIWVCPHSRAQTDELHGWIPAACITLSLHLLSLHIYHSHALSDTLLVNHGNVVVVF